MRLLEINLATRPFRNNTLYYVGFGSAACVLLALTTLNLWVFFNSGSSVQQYEQETVLKKQKRDGLSRDEQRLGIKLTKLDFGGLEQEAEFANDAIRRRIFSWTELFNRLETVVPPTVMLTSVRPEIQAEGISIVSEGLAKDQEALLKFEEGLIGSAYFARIYPGSERREQRGGDLHFSVKFDYLPMGRPEAAPAAPAKIPPKTDSKMAGTPEAAPAEPKPVKPPTDSPALSQDAKPPEAPISISRQAAPPPAAAPPAPASAHNTQNIPPSKVTRPPVTAPPGARASPAPGTNPRFTLNAKRGGPAGRPMLHPGMGNVVRIGANLPADPDAEVKIAAAAAAAKFTDRPLEEVIAYLTKNRSMTFIFDGSFDLRQKVTMDVYDKEQWEIVEMVAQKLGAVPNQDGENTYRFAPPKPPEAMDEPDVDEEPVVDQPPEEPPPTDGGQ